MISELSTHKLHPSQIRPVCVPKTIVLRLPHVPISLKCSHLFPPPPPLPRDNNKKLTLLSPRPDADIREAPAINWLAQRLHRGYGKHLLLGQLISYSRNSKMLLPGTGASGLRNYYSLNYHIQVPFEHDNLTRKNIADKKKKKNKHPPQAKN